MKDTIKYNQWTAFLEEYKEYIQFQLDYVRREKSGDEVWYETFKQLKTFMNENKTRPLQHSTNTIETRLSNWTLSQLQNYKNKKQAMKDETKYDLWTEFMEEYKEYFKSHDEVWYETLKQVKQFICENKRLPTNKDNKILNKWVSHQQYNYKKKEYGMKDTIKYNLWTAFLEEYTEYMSPTKTPKKKSMKLNTSSSSTEPKESPEQSRQRVKSEMSELHQQYKTLTSYHLNTLFHTNPNLWYYYQAMSESNEASFPEAEIPRNRIIRAIDQIRTKRTKRVVDMGCGKAQIAQHFQNDHRFEFFNYDHVASNDSVISCDISKTPLEDDSVEICILSLAMWGSNCEQYIQEAYRILESGGKLYIIEPTKRWTEKDSDGILVPGTEGDRLKQKIEAAGFRIIQTQIAKFCMFEAYKC